MLHLHLSISTALMRRRRAKQYCLQLVIYISVYLSIYLYIYIYIYIDDIFLIRKGDKDSLIDFLDYLHNVAPSIKFTHEISTDDVTITVIGQIRKDYLTIDRKKELIRNREMFWQRMLNSIQPNGLNKRTG